MKDVVRNPVSKKSNQKRPQLKSRAFLRASQLLVFVQRMGWQWFMKRLGQRNPPRASITSALTDRRLGSITVTHHRSLSWTIISSSRPSNLTNIRSKRKKAWSEGCLIIRGTFLLKKHHHEIKAYTANNRSILDQHQICWLLITLEPQQHAKSSLLEDLSATQSNTILLNWAPHNCVDNCSHRFSMSLSDNHWMIFARAVRTWWIFPCLQQVACSNPNTKWIVQVAIWWT